jgi:hypothetical protein
MYKRFDELGRKFREDSSAAIETQLKHILKKLYRKVYRAFKARMFLPVNNEGGAGLNSVSALTLDLTGKAKIIGLGASDLGAGGNVTIREDKYPVVSLAAAIVYHYRQLEQFARLNINLPFEVATAAKRSIDALADEIALLGNAEYGLPGLIDDFAALNEEIGADWNNLDGDELYELLLPFLYASTQDTDQFENDTLIIPTTYVKAMSKRMPNSDSTVAEYIKKNSPVKNIGSWHKLNTASANGRPLALCYPRDPEVVELIIPRETEWVQAEWSDMQFKTPGIMDIVGTVKHHPKLISFMEIYGS